MTSNNRLPRVSIAILNYQREHILQQALRRAVMQDYPHLEVLVIDNASSDESARMVERDFPDVRLIRLLENVGCAARNVGVAAATGEIVVTIDNDVFLATQHDVRNIVAILDAHPSVASVNFKILDAEGNLSRRDWCHPRDWRTFGDQEFFSDYVLEGASAIRRQAFEEVGGYWAPFFLGHEGLDLALRLLEAGYAILYSPQVHVTHLASKEARPPSRIYYTYTRNSIWVSLRNHRPLAMARGIIKDLALMAFCSARAGQWGGYLRGLRDGVAGTPRALASRKPLSRATYRRLRDVRRHQPNLFEKARRHWNERPL